MMLVYGLTIVIAASWLIKMLVLKKVVILPGPFGLFLLFFLVSQTLATIFSIDLHTSIWGYYSRFHGGFLSTIAYVVLYFAFVNNLSSLSHLRNLFKVMLLSGFLLSLYGIAEHFGIDRDLWVQDVQNRVFSTLGQPNWLAAYLAILLPITMGIGLSSLLESQNSKLKTQKYKSNVKSNKPKTFDFLHEFLTFDFSLLTYFVLSLVFYLVLLYTKSRSGLIGFWIADVIFWTFILNRTRFVILSFVIGHLSFVILTFFVGGSGLGPLEKFTYQKLFLPPTSNLTPPTANFSSSTSILETGVTESSDIRKIVWQGAVDIFRHYPIFGSGVETFAYAYYQYRPVKHNMTSEWDFLYNKAHNEYLNFLATTGVVGLGSYLLFIASYVWWFFKKFALLRQNDVYLIIGLFTGWISILITNFFGFSVVMVGLFFFLIPALSFLLVEEKKNTQNSLTSEQLSTGQAISISLIFLISLIVLVQLGRLWFADTVFAKGYRENRSSQFVEAYGNLTTAIKINPQEPFYGDELAFVSAVLAIALDKEKDATAAAVLQKQAILLSNKVVAENPRNINFLKSRVRIFFALSQIDPALKGEALSALEKAQILAPTDPKITYNLAVLYHQIGQNDKAIEYFKKTIKLKPDYRDAYYSLALFYQDQKDLKKAKEQLNFILTKLNPNDEQAKKKLEEINH
ncbi:O-antigen ligase family protein [Candidatus Gottesmanbacteria bacterium]|nr:O-antigen ligase family protein [Candidatus Gottesmanbacteria bacterium]